MTVREFAPEDAEFCFRVRCAAFIEEFYAEVGPRVVSLCINEHMPRDFIRLSEQMKIFIAENSGKRIGFFSIKRTDHDSAEIPFIYFELARTNSGYGRKCIAYIDNWIRANWNEVKRIYLDTIIPVYNGGFYEKMAYKETGESFCMYSGCKVKARRYEKRLQ